MVDDIGRGFHYAVVVILFDIVSSAFLGAFSTLSMSYYLGIVLVIGALNLVGCLVVVLKFESWGYGFLIGWLVGQWVFFYAGFIEFLLFIFYMIIGLGVLFFKMIQWVRERM